VEEGVMAVEKERFDALGKGLRFILDMYGP
jgi:hypothetical protein